MFFRFAASAVFTLFLSPVWALGAQTHSVVHETYSDFFDGELTNVSLHRNGQLRLAPSATEIASLVDPVIWSAAFGPDGDLFVAAGNDGKVYRISGEGELSEFADTEEVFVRALAVGSDGRLYLGSSPEGKVYRVGDGGELETFFEPRETYIWSLLFDDAGDLFVATGDKGRIYRVPADSEPGSAGEVFFESSETHISTLARDADGRLVAGTAPNGYVYRIEARNDAFLLFNSAGEEIRQIVTDASGDLFVATFSGSRQGGGSGPVAGAVASLSPGSADETGSSDSGSSGGSGQQPPGILHRVDSDGFYEPHWGLSGVSIHSLLQAPDGNLLLGSGADGRIFSVEDVRSWELRQTLPTGSEVTALLRVPGGDDIVALTSNPARVFRLDFELSGEGEFLSEVFDAKQIARWGRFYAETGGEAGAGVEVFARTGNSEKANAAWSSWRPVADGNLQPARYLQYRLNFREPGAEVQRVRFFYRHANAAPAVSAVRAVSAGVGFEQYELPPQQPPVDLEQLFRGNAPPAATPEPRQQLRAFERPGTVTIAWQARDPDGDDLRFTAQLRHAESDAWKTFGSDLDETFLSIDGNGLAEGFYQAKVIASDHRSNPPGEARTGERVSVRFLIVNNAPEIEVLEISETAAGAEVAIRVSDAWSILASAETILNGEEPVSAFPEDGLFDSREETFRIELNDLEPGAHTLLFRVRDEKGNVRVQLVPLEIAPR